MSKKEKKANKQPMDVSVKSAIISSISAILCVAIIVVSFAMGIQKISDNSLKIAEAAASNSSSGSSSSTDDSYVDNSGNDAVVDNGTSTDDGTSTDAPVDSTTPDDGTSTDAPADSTDAQSPTQATKPSDSTNASTGSKAPSSVADILKYYNTATKKVADKKLAFHKERSSVEKSYEAGIALNTFKSLVYQFMGVGDANKYVADITKDDADSYHKYFLASSLTAANVKDAKLVDNNGTYTITINLKDGKSEVKDGNVVSAGGTALDKCGISAGENDKDYWDHKNAQNVYSAISSLAAKANISESYSNAVVKAVINSKTGNLTSLTVSFDFKYDISNVVGSKGLATGASTVTMTGFKW